jgi:hypothetical protein
MIVCSNQSQSGICPFHYQVCHNVYNNNNNNNNYYYYYYFGKMLLLKYLLYILNLSGITSNVHAVVMLVNAHLQCITIVNHYKYRLKQLFLRSFFILSYHYMFRSSRSSSRDIYNYHDNYRTVQHLRYFSSHLYFLLGVILNFLTN